MRCLPAWLVAALVAVVMARPAEAQPADEVPQNAAPQEPEHAPAAVGAPEPAAPAEPPPEPEPTSEPAREPTIAFHGFISEGGFWSTSNDYLGASSRGSLKLFEAGLNVSTEVADRLRAGMQIFARDVGDLEDAPRFDWAFLDYRWQTWLGLRAGIIKMPFGLYNEYTDTDSARLPILMPQSVYSVVIRDVLLSHRGFALYGTYPLPQAGELDYQVWLGTLAIPHNALTILGGTLDSIDTKYVTGAQLFWTTPVEGLRIGGTMLSASIDFNLTLSEENIAALIAAGVVPADYDGKVVISQRPDTWVIGSAEYTRGEWLVAAEYSRAFKRQRSTLPAVLPTFKEDSERFYGLVAYRASEHLELGGYYSVNHLDAGDRRGRDPKYPERFLAWQRDLAATVRVDINDHWLWKLEGHFIDGAADLPVTRNPQPDRYWGLVLLRTTVTF